MTLKNANILKRHKNILLAEVSMGHTEGYLVIDDGTVYAFETERYCAELAYSELVIADTGSKSELKKYVKLTPENFIEELGTIYAEHRSDVSDMCQSYLNGTLPVDWKTWREHRFVHKTVGSYNLLYDTLTTQIEYQDPKTKDWINDGTETYSD